MTKKSIELHIKSNDYFGTLATVLSLIRQSPKNIKENLKVLNGIEKDLVYLQKYYEIKERIRYLNIRK